MVQATFSRIIACDDVLPFGFLLVRPYMTYAMASAILTVGGARTGETLVGHADFQLADNVVQKMHIVNFTMYLKSIVYQPHLVYIADNIMVRSRYNCSPKGGGGSASPCTPSGPGGQPRIGAAAPCALRFMGFALSEAVRQDPWGAGVGVASPAHLCTGVFIQSPEN